ncbi:hypothetical protein, variant 1 [Aphanomyces astaci]|uniref:Uncharacterized protein n=1 Tax=Aphanomyces astaci TaxID=112090 RepID=W4FVL6_APHAT|nr:hypothetical protein H257_13726 [Aphanomyces astaci]XP_009839660.1 hypothetical protein, variant 2 [Aphanomyces astaci]XP_009839661.1 hypothetical protein, variant 1 [Aphanomyces astaci]ETV70996.1 hypothetical protein H257_13726 [Aphanomyces astaci]ETV70997.1 hypothetical protein, variant 1 [Aphanomyces astaci]ETV70998.1 hypothetical protein, variant 2 [Aphanomyces astaci]|eukprot:XP_009839659.1 hypothetical protein H257_13726 [Aphanomyces astaci]
MQQKQPHTSLSHATREWRRWNLPRVTALSQCETLCHAPPHLRRVPGIGELVGSYNGAGRHGGCGRSDRRHSPSLACDVPRYVFPWWMRRHRRPSAGIPWRATRNVHQHELGRQDQARFVSLSPALGVRLLWQPHARQFCPSSTQSARRRRKNRRHIPALLQPMPDVELHVVGETLHCPRWECTMSYEAFKLK